MVGSAIVPILMAAVPDADARLLIRADTDSAMSARMEGLFRYWGWQDEPSMKRRVRGLRGDAAVPQFGLSDDDYTDLKATCSNVIHSAGTVRMNLALEDARRSAVGSTLRILELCRHLQQSGRLAKVDFVSTVGVAGKQAGLLCEDWLDQMPQFHNTYEQAKAEAEQLIRKAIDGEYLPITVHRPSMVVGDSRDGRVIHFQIFYFLSEFLSGRKTLGLYPDFNEVRLDIIPCDTVATAIVEASRDPSTEGRIFNLCSGPSHAPLLEEVKRSVRGSCADHGIAVPRPFNVPLSWYKQLARAAALVAPPKQRKTLATLPIYLDYLADRQGFKNEQFLSWFQTRGHRVPEWREYLPRVLDRYLSQRFPI